MDVQLKELIEKIKSEGVASAEQEAKKIMAEAQEKASRLLHEASQQIQSQKAQAEADLKKLESASRDALGQAARDLLLSLEKRLVALFDSLLAQSVGEVLTGANLEKILLQVVGSWNQGEKPLQVLLSAPDFKALSSGFQAKLAKSLTQGVELLESVKVESGFRIGEKNGAAYYDFSSEGIAQVLSSSLSPELSKILKSAVK